ncbi:MAG: M15 family metallopeptidase [Ilumatobacteraceae bacterium]
MSLAAAFALAAGLVTVPRAVAGRPTTDSVAVPASADRVAGRVASTSEAVSVSVYGAMPKALLDTLEGIGASIGIPSVRGRSFNAGLYAVRRGDQVVQQASGSSGVWQFPMSVTALPVDAVGRVMSARVSSAVASGGVVLGSTSASLRGAQVGDTLDLIASDGNTRRFVLGYVAPDDEIGGAELVMSPEQADALGATIVTRVLFFGQFARSSIEEAFAANGLYDGGTVRISRSWSGANPDSLLGSAQLKTLLNEFDYRINGDSSLTLDPDWVADNLQRVSFRGINVRSTCHRAIVADLQAALDEVSASGLAGAIDLGNTNTYGGCYNPRFARVSGSIGSVSRHAWAVAIDMNTVSNAQGRVPQMDCRVVRIFRKHGFAWGGNFLVPDGMHFEWVGVPRNTIQYPSEYCPNLPGGAISGLPGLSTQTVPDNGQQRATMFADDALTAENLPDEGS